MARPRSHHLKKLPVRIFLTLDELRAASPINDWAAPVPHAEQIKQAVLWGAKARARAARVGPAGHEIGPNESGGIDLLFRVHTPHGAAVLNDLIRIYEERMNENQTDKHEHDLPAALIEMREAVRAIGENDVIVHGPDGETIARIFYYRQPEELQ